MTGYTPDMDAVREDWMQAAANPEGYALVNMDPPSDPELRAQFDRFIAKVRADALREAAEGFRHCKDYGYRATRMRATEDYLNDKADDIEGATK